MTAASACLAFHQVRFSGPVWLVRAVGWVGLVFFGLCVVAVSWHLASARPVLTADAEGIRCRRYRVPWSEVAAIGISTVVGQRFLTILLRNSDTLIASRPALVRPVMRWNQRLAGTPLAVAASMLPGSIEQVRDRIEAYRSKVAASV